MEEVDEVASLEFKWLKKRGVGGKKKEIQFYESFIYDGVEYALYDCVYMYKEGVQEPYIGKLIKVWELPDKTKRVKVHWFFRPREISKWLGDTKILENEILLASGEGVGLANINPLEAITGRCNVVCMSKDCRNPQPSDKELQVADYIFHRTFDVQSCTISDKMDDKIGGLEIKYIFNRKKGENISTLPECTSDRKEENKTTTSGEPEQLLTKSLSNKLKDGRENNRLSVTVDVKGEYQDKDIPNFLAERISQAALEPSSGSGVDLKRVDETNSEFGEPDSCIVKADKDNLKLKDISLRKDDAGKDEMEASIDRVHMVEAKKRNKTCMGFDKLHNRPSKKIKSSDDTPRVGKQVKFEVAWDSDTLEDVPSKKSQVDDSIRLPVDCKLKHEEKLPLHVNNLKASGTSGITEEISDRKNAKVLLGSDKGMISAEVTGDLEGRISKTTKADSSLKRLDNKRNNSVQKLSINTVGSNGKGLVSTSAFAEGKPKSGLALYSLGTNKEPRGEPSGEGKRKLSMSMSPKVSAPSTDKDKKTTYKEFVVGPKPNVEKSGWFRRLPWEQRLKDACDQGTAILLHNVDPDYTSGEVEDMIWHAFSENCDAKILQHTAVSSPHCGQALILLKTKEAAQRVLTKLDEECLMLSNGRPLVGTTCPSISRRKISKFFGHLAIDKIRLQNQQDEAVSTSHFSQPNTIEYDMAMEWFLLQSRSKRWWRRIHKQQGDELKKLETNLRQK